MRYLKILFLSLMVVGLIASGAFAGNMSYIGSGFVANTTLSVALEAMGGARNMTIVSSTPATTTITTPALVINPSQALVSGSLLTISFVNAGFDGSTVYLCQIDAANNTGVVAYIASTTPSANATSQAFVLSSGTAAGNSVMITTSANSTNCVGNGAFIVRFQPVSSAAMASVSYNVTQSGTVYDSGNAANNIANVSRQYNATYANATSFIDFLNAPANGSKFTTNSAYTATTSNVILGNAAKNVNTTSAPASLTVAAVISLQDSASWQGVSSVYARSDGTTCDATGTNNVANNSPSGTVNLTLPSAVFNGAVRAAANVVLCAQVAGNTTLQTRTIKAAADINVTGTGANDPAIETYTTVMNWQSNGYQGVIPYISASSTFTTICFLSNKSSQSGPVTVDIMTSQSGASLASLTALSLGTVPALGTMRMDFASGITPYTYAGGVESAGTATALTGLQANDRYTAMINIGASPSSVTVNCIQLDPAGSKRAVPVLTQISSGNPFQQ